MASARCRDLICGLHVILETKGPLVLFVWILGGEILRTVFRRNAVIGHDKSVFLIGSRSYSLIISFLDEIGLFLFRDVEHKL